MTPQQLDELRELARKIASEAPPLTPAQREIVRAQFEAQREEDRQKGLRSSCAI